MEGAVCDDNELFLREIEGRLKTLPMVDNIHIFSNLDTFLFSIDEGKRYDAVLMDIEWNDIVAGMDAAEELYNLCPEAKIIFVTGRADQYSQQIFLKHSNLSGYLTKPVSIELLQANLQKVADALSYENQTVLTLRRQGSAVSVPTRDIHFIESENHTIHIHTSGETITVYDRLENIMRSLPAGFYQCHKSYIVNMRRIRRFQANDILLKNGERVPVSRSKYNETKEAYFNYIGQIF